MTSPQQNCLKIKETGNVTWPPYDRLCNHFPTIFSQDSTVQSAEPWQHWSWWTRLPARGMVLVLPHQQKPRTGSAHTSVSSGQQPANLKQPAWGWWLGKHSDPMLLMLQFALLFPVSGGFENYHRHLLTRNVPVLPKLRNTWTSISPSYQKLISLSSSSGIYCMAKEREHQDLQQQVRYFKVYKPNLQFLCKCWMQWRRSQFLVALCSSSHRLLPVSLKSAPLSSLGFYPLVKTAVVCVALLLSWFQKRLNKPRKGWSIGD